MPAILTLCLSFAIVFLAKRTVSFLNALKSIQNLHGSRLFIAPESILGLVIRKIPGLAYIPGLTLSNNFVFEWKHGPYADEGWDVRSMVSLLPNTSTFLLVADAAIAKIALFVISAAGFGRSISWADNGAIPEGHSMSFKQAVNIMSKDFLIPVVMPKWMMGITNRTKAAGDALIEIRKYMSEMIQERLHSEKVQRNDLFSSLLEANDQGFDNTEILNEEELIGNIFIFLLAGHETTAHTLAFAFALLALYPDEQEKLYQHVTSVLQDSRDPTYEDMSSLTYSMAVFLEVLRLYPPVPGFPKACAEDTVLTTQNINGDVKSIPVPKGSFVAICSTAIHYNPRYWSEPHSFQPSRFLQPDWPRDAFLPFSAGTPALTCSTSPSHVIYRFSETEAVVILSMLVAKYKISVKEEPQFANETFEERKSRIMANENFMTLTYVLHPLFLFFAIS
ncbi:hypothetical protein CVT24_010512 [Panaeolus cyanescens]|uniref:Cytochrome P450 n=1 Tax=Panaeolus cyanescens TaxID=181874 RepID=A0A409YVU4_9AGAR|nr:hypothetical protein CVT24_010512 [Panaeolus cyanescens]